MLDEPPGADQHAGVVWDWGLETPGYPIMLIFIRAIQIHKDPLFALRGNLCVKL